MKETANAIITLTPLPELGLALDANIFIFVNNPKTRANINRKGKAY